MLILDALLSTFISSSMLSGSVFIFYRLLLFLLFLHHYIREWSCFESLIDFDRVYWINLWWSWHINDAHIIISYYITPARGQSDHHSPQSIERQSIRRWTNRRKKRTKKSYNYFRDLLLERNAEMTRRWEMSIEHPTQTGGGPHQIIPHLKNPRKQKRGEKKEKKQSGKK